MFQSPPGGGTDSPQSGMDMPVSPQQRPQSAAPPVRVEVRHGSAPPVGFDVTGDDFVIGSTPGCDLRLPGANLPPQVCAISRTPDGARLRKLAPALPILLNGSPLAPTAQADLRHGDVVSVGPVDLHILIAFRMPQPATVAPPESTRIPETPARPEDWDRHRRELEVRAKALEEQARELEADRVLWYERRQEMEREIRTARHDLDEGRRGQDRSALVAELRAQIEQETADSFRVRREELERMQLAIREAALQLREQKQQFEDGLKNIDPRFKELERREKEFAGREKAVESATAELKKKWDGFDAERRVQEVRLQQRDQDLARREVELAARELAARELAAAAEQDCGRYQTDLVRVDRLAAALEGKEKSLELRAVEVDRRYEQFQRDSREFEEQLRLFDDREEGAKDEDARLAARSEELDAREARLNGRIAEIETQQATLFALRTRLEHLRDELRRDEARLADERSRTADDVREAALVRGQMETEKDSHAESYRLFEERSSLMAQAVNRLRVMQDQLAAEEQRLHSLDEELSARAAEQAEQAGMFQAKAEQLLEAQQRVEADRRALKEREAALLRAEEAREALQDQLRLRSEELASRQRELDERSRELDARTKEMTEQLGQLEELRANATSARRLTDEETAILAQRDERLRAAEQTIAEQNQQLLDAQTRFEHEQIYGEERLDAARADVEELKEALALRTDELLAHMPDLEQRAQAALERTAQAREAMRGQLAELHGYAIKSQEDLQAVRAQVQVELGRVRDEEQALNRARTEHRLAVSSFRQQLIEWQGRFADLKQALFHGETRLDRREKAVEATAVELAARAEQIQQQEVEVSEKRTEVDRHLGEMQAWFRQKFREIAETRWSQFKVQGTGDSGILPLPPRPATESTGTAHSPAVILPLPDDLEPGDRKLGDLLRTLDIVDRDTLFVLWDEARRQRRTLRQVLLAGGYLTLYQLALIESGNLAGLMLGRFRVIDRLLATVRESIYRVFDPQLRSQESGVRSLEEGTCLLRHLGESEMLDAVRPDEYRQRFGAARDLAHPNVAATLEVLEVNGRPAVVQEWLHGLAGMEWPAAVSSPGVWHRLMMQAVLGLHAAHSAGLTHGCLTANSFLLTRQGVVKLVGVGEPPWLHAGGGNLEARFEEDLKALGQVALGWMQGGRRRGVRPKPFPASLLNILRHLGATPEDGGAALSVYPTTGALLADLDQAAGTVPSDQGAWEKLLAYVEENAGDGMVLRQSA